MTQGPVYRNANEPQVTVKGIPQSQYNANPPVAPSGGGIGGWIKMHPIMAIAGGLGLVVVLILVYQYFKNNSSSASSGIDPNTGIPYAQEQQGIGYNGAQNESDMQQLMAFQNEEIGLLQQIANQQSGNSNNNNNNNNATTYTITAADLTGGIGPHHNPLEAIAQKEGFASWQDLYNFGTNAQTIQATAKSHNVNPTKGYGGWHRYLYVGEQIQI